MNRNCGEDEYRTRGERHLGWEVTHEAGITTVVDRPAGASWALLTDVYIRAWIGAGWYDDGWPEDWAREKLDAAVCREQCRLGAIVALGGNITDSGDPQEIAAIRAVIDDPRRGEEREVDDVPRVQIWTVADPFAGEIEVVGETIEAAVADAYEEIPTEERPTYVWYGRQRISVPGGTCRPV